MSGITFHQPVQQRFDKLRGVIWDLDDTLYRLGQVTEEAFDIAIARAAIAAGVDLPFEVAVEMAHNSYKNTGVTGGRVFIERYELNPKDFHHSYHKLIDETIIEKSARIVELFAKLTLKNAIVTHGSRDWATRVLTHLGLTAYFPPENIFGQEEYDFRPKHQYKDGFERALSALNLPPENVAVVEDSLSNLDLPHKMGLLTIYLRHGRPLQPQGFLHVSADDVEEILEAL